MLNEDQIKLLDKLICQTLQTDKFHYQITKYLFFLLKKNQELNLVSRQMDIETIIVDHIFDCLAGFEYFESYPDITDLGSGGGFPGLLLAIAHPQKKVILIEKSPKKAAFLNDACVHLSLDNVTVYNGLVGDKKIRTSCITCRGFKPINVILDMTAEYFKNGGTYLLYKGKIDKIEEELKLARKKFTVHQKIVKIDKIKNKERYLVIINEK